jgi:hypothetical protein
MRKNKKMKFRTVGELIDFLKNNNDIRRDTLVFAQNLSAGDFYEDTKVVFEEGCVTIVFDVGEEENE